jgi:hypothetical protein
MSTQPTRHLGVGGLSVSALGVASRQPLHRGAAPGFSQEVADGFP